MITDTTRARGWSRALRELAFVLSAALTYLAVRGLTAGSEDRAVSNADLLVRLERALGIFRERGLQRIIVDDAGLGTIVNWIYIWGFWPVIALVATWLYLRRPAAYYRFRNAFLLSGSVGLIVFMIVPVAPPRLADLGFVDTIELHSQAYRALQPPSLVNQYAAMPSFHFGWLVLLALALYRESTVAAVRYLGWLAPVAMGVTIVATGNHFIVDGVAGAALSLAALAVVSRISALKAPAWLGRRHGRQLEMGAPATPPIPPSEPGRTEARR